MKRKKMVAGNWKMNQGFQEAEDLLFDIDEIGNKRPAPGVKVVICPPFPYLEMATDLASESHFSVGAQNLYPGDHGAFTGEISAGMLNTLEVEYCIIGHSERRKLFHEDHALIAAKVLSALEHGIIPVFCCGESLTQRENGTYKEVVSAQVNDSLFALDKDHFAGVIIAYEPVWAIGTGVNATPEQAQEMHAFIRQLVAAQYGPGTASQTLILYGGSCNRTNAASLFALPDVDGGLVGGASLKAAEFWEIVHAFPKGK